MSADFEYWEGKQRWIAARSASLTRVRRLSQTEAAAKAKREFAQFTALDRRSAAGRQGVGAADTDPAAGS